MQWTERQNIFPDVNVKISKTSYCESGVNESYIKKSIGKERMGIIWLKAGIWK
jgi:hypothetical protein